MQAVSFVAPVLIAAAAVAAAAQRAPSPQVHPALHALADGLGMLRTIDEEDKIATLRYWAEGTMTAGGRPCTLKTYAVAVNYHVPGMRTDYTCDGGRRQIEVISGTFAWNEDAPGGKATPAPAAVNERLLQLWALPHAAVKAALEAGNNTRVSTENGATVLTFPVPHVNATLKATLNAKPVAVVEGSADLRKAPLPAGGVIERIEMRMGNSVREVLFSEWGDWNGSDYYSDVVFPRRIVHRQGGGTVLDLTVTRTNTYNPYVVVPVPANVGAAGSK